MPETIDPIWPLAAFYRAVGRTPPSITQIEGSDMPQPYSQLLVHKTDMTGTLERYYNDTIHLKVIDTVREGNVYSRQVALVLDAGKRAVEFGAICMYLDAFPAPVRELILKDDRPLGSIMTDLALPHSSNPHGYFTVESDDLIANALQFTDRHTLYGRCNIISSNDTLLADIVEILPPKE
jgi:chorismate-pyruvate lyase